MHPVQLTWPPLSAFWTPIAAKHQLHSTSLAGEKIEKYEKMMFSNVLQTPTCISYQQRWQQQLSNFSWRLLTTPDDSDDLDRWRLLTTADDSWRPWRRLTTPLTTPDDPWRPWRPLTTTLTTPDDPWRPLTTPDDPWRPLTTWPDDDSWRPLTTPDDPWRPLTTTPDDPWRRLLTTPDDPWRPLTTPDDPWRLLTTPDDSWRLTTPDDPWRPLTTPDDPWRPLTDCHRRSLSVLTPLSLTFVRVLNVLVCRVDGREISTIYPTYSVERIALWGRRG